MKTNIFRLLLLCACLTGLRTSHAQQPTQQPYKLSAGLRLGSPLAISLKYFPTAKGAVEGFIGNRSYNDTWYGYSYSSTIIGATYSLYTPIPIKDVKGLQWFIGGGGALYLWSWGNNIYLADRYSTVSAGIVLHGGLDYKIENMPLNVSLDWMPIYSLSDYNTGFYAGYGAVSVRYVLK